MIRPVLMVCAVLSAGLLAQPADARPRKEERREQSHEHREERRHSREEHQHERREQREEHWHERHDIRGGWRDDRGDHHGHRDRAAREAQRQNGGGRILSVEPESDGYRVKVLKDGEVRTHHVTGD